LIPAALIPAALIPAAASPGGSFGAREHQVSFVIQARRAKIPTRPAAPAASRTAAMLTNAFSKTWCHLFLDGVPDGDTQRETDFVRRNLPQPEHLRVLDVACGSGRHSRALADAGYSVLGIDRAPALVADAERSCDRARFQVLDMRDMGQLDGAFDGVVNLWQSFGFYDAETNRGVLGQFHDKLRPGGRAILDLYNRDNAIGRPPIERARRDGVTIETRRSWTGSRLALELWYDGVLGDRFDWHLYSPDELCAVCNDVGFEVILTCAWFDEAVPASPEHVRMQLVLERPRAPALRSQGGDGTPRCLSKNATRLVIDRTRF
jgi:SAM-dependent methyltransferase